MNRTPPDPDPAPISIVIPYRDRNTARVTNALNSYLWQTTPPLEVIVVDYGSEPGHARSIKAETASRGFRYLRASPPDQAWSYAKAANIGIRASRGKYVAVTGIDMMLAPNFVAELQKAHDKKSVFVIARVSWLDNEPWTPKPFTDTFNAWEEAASRATLAGKIHRHAVMSAPRKWWFKARGFDERIPGMGADIDIRDRIRNDPGIEIIDICDPDDPHHATTIIHQPHEWGQGKGDEPALNKQRREALRDTSLTKNSDEWGTSMDLAASTENVETKETNDGHYWRCHWLISKAGEASASGAILNIGAADGWMFDKHDYNVTDLDKLNESYHTGSKPYVQADAHSLPFPNDHFAASILGDMLEHVENPVQVLSEAGRVAPRVYITVPNEWEWAPEMRPFGQASHIRQYTARTLAFDIQTALGPGYRIHKVNGGGWSFFCAEWEREKAPSTPPPTPRIPPPPTPTHTDIPVLPPGAEYTDIFDARTGGKPCTQWMASSPSTKITNTGYWHDFWRGREGDKEYAPRREIILGDHSHDEMHEAHGTQPFGSYLRGHINGCMGIRTSPDAPIHKPDTSRWKPYITCQMYYTSNITREDYVPRMATILRDGLETMLAARLIDRDTKVYLENHCHDWNDYKCHPFVILTASQVIDAMNLPRAEAIYRLRAYSEYGTQHTDRARALSAFELPE